LCIAFYYYTQTDVRGGFFSFVLFVALMLGFGARSWLVRGIVSTIPVWMVVMSVCVAMFLNDSFWNGVLSGRPDLYYSFISELSLIDFLFGTSVKDFDLTAIVDNSYIHLYMVGGFVFFSYFSLNFWLSAKNIFKNNRIELIAFMVSVSAYMFTESLLVRIENPFVMLYWYVIFKYSNLRFSG
jgi:hypothetical protein